MTMAAFDEIFATVPVEQRQILAQFRASHPYKELDVAGRRWRYIACGRGGKALLFLVEVLGLDDPSVVPFYIGDDVTDEDAFEVLRDRGIGILVSEVPRSTQAAYWVQAPWEVYALFERLLSLEGGGE